MLHPIAGRLLPKAPPASYLKDIPTDVTTRALEQELAADHPPAHELFALPHHARPTWPKWKWGVLALEMGLSYYV